MTIIGQIGIRQQVAHRLKQAREAAGFETPDAFCAAYNIPLKEYMRHEEGKSALRASHAARYSRQLDISLFWLMLGHDD